MPKLPQVKDRQFVAAMGRLGFFEHRQRGTSHMVLKHSDDRRTTVSMHPGKDIPRGTLGGMLREALISTEEFLVALKNI